MPSLESYKGYYYIKFYDSVIGYTRRVTTSLKATPGNKQEAKRRVKLFTQNHAQGFHLFTHNKINRITLDDALQEFLELKSFKPKTKLIYKSAVDHVKAVSNSAPVHSIDKTHIRLLLKRWNEKALSRNSQSMYCRHLSALWKYFVKEGYAEENLIPKIKYINKEPEDIAVKDLKIILDYLDGKQYHVVKFLLTTGVRISTLLDLDWKDINWKEGFITFRNIKVNEQPFTYPLTQEIRSQLKEMKPQLGGKIFEYKNIEGIKSFWYRALDKLEIPGKYTLHQLRKTYFSIRVNSGMSLDDLSRITNTDARTLKKHYAKFNRERLKAELEESEKFTRNLLEPRTKISSNKHGSLKNRGKIAGKKR